jgi:hypothetical protein
MIISYLQLSGYYYTPMRNIFIGALCALCALAVFFVAYRGYDRADSAMTNIAVLCTIATALCPTTPPDNSALCQTVIGDLHLFFSCVAFVMLAVMALRFAKKEPTPPGLSFWQAVGYAFGFTRAAAAAQPRWDVVTVLMTAFGISWFLKGGKLLARPSTA